MKNGDPDTKYLNSKQFRIVQAVDPKHPVLFLDDVPGQFNARAICIQPRCGCDRVPLTRLDEDRWQCVLKRAGEQAQTVILTGWSGPTL